jgi:LuxR family transcriptional regulator, maltose regulon positive regulatory protein
MLDRALAKRVTVISAPPGSGKTSLLRAWARRSTSLRRVAFVSVDRNQQDAQRFWPAVLAAIGRPTSSVRAEMQPAASASLDADELADRVLSELAEQVEPVVLIIDDVHELRSADALTQLEHLLAVLPSSARVVLSSRRDPPIRLHQLRLVDEVAEIRAGDLRFTESETRELLASSGISLSDGGAASLYERTEGWAAGLRLAAISLSRHPDPERFVAEFSGTDRAIGEYLMAEMLERQPSEVQSMLLRTSLSGPKGRTGANVGPVQGSVDAVRLGRCRDGPSARPSGCGHALVVGDDLLHRGTEVPCAGARHPPGRGASTVESYGSGAPRLSS